MATSKSQAEVKDLLQKARNVAPAFKQLYEDRRKQMQEERTQLLKDKEQALQAAEEKSLRQINLRDSAVWTLADTQYYGLGKEMSKSAKLKFLKLS